MRKGPARGRASRRTARSGGLLLAVLVDLFEIGIDDVGFLAGFGLGVGLGLLLLRGLVHGLAELHRNFGERLRLGVDRLGVVAFSSALQRRDGVGDRVA